MGIKCEGKKKQLDVVQMPSSETLLRRSWAATKVAQSSHSYDVSSMWFLVGWWLTPMNVLL